MEERKVVPVRLERVVRGIKQYELAAAAGIHFSLMSMIEIGRRKPTEEQKVLIAKALGVPVRKLFPKE